MSSFISVIIPNHNGGDTIEKCLGAVFSSRYQPFEVIVVDDASSDNSVELISRFPCRLIRLEKRTGASGARNTGARASAGEVLFFIDADCVMAENTLSLVHNAVVDQKDVVVGGSYTPIPYDSNFFSIFQSIFINYFELKRTEPDYIASHAMALEKSVFESSGGFHERFLPIIEDVELSHRLRRSGHRLQMAPDILVRHIFNFTFWKSLRNAYRKSRYWIMYSLENRDVFTDSGTASQELKVNVVSFFLILFFLMLYLSSASGMFLFFPLITACFNLYINRNLLRAFARAQGALFGIPAALYYTLIYPLAVGMGSFSGMINYYRGPGQVKSD
jgi:GT2 family glycosyltransferase